MAASSKPKDFSAEKSKGCPYCHADPASWTGLVRYRDPIADQQPQGCYVKLIDPEDMPEFINGMMTFACRVAWRLTYVKFGQPFGNVDVEYCFFQRGSKQAIEPFSLRGAHDHPYSAPHVLNRELDLMRNDTQKSSIKHLGANYEPAPVVEDNPVLFNLARLRASLEHVDKVVKDRQYLLVHTLRYLNPAKQQDYYHPCLELAMALSLNPFVIRHWDSSIHRKKKPDDVVCLMLRELPGVNLLTTLADAPKNVLWKKVELPEYDSWLRIYSPESKEERLAHAARIARSAQEALEAEEKSMLS